MLKLSWVYLFLSMITFNARSSELKSIIPFIAESGMDLGVGYHSGITELSGTCVEFSEIRQVANLQGQKVQFSFRKIENKNELLKELDISASLALKAAFFGIDGKAHYFEQIKINHYSIYYLVKLEVLNNTHIVKNPNLTKNALELLKNKGGEAFFRQCGDEFINSYTSGGRFYTLIEIQTSDESEKESINSIFQGSLRSLASSIGADFQKAISSIKNSKLIYINMYIEGGAIKISYDPESILKVLETFNEKVSGGLAVPILASTIKYDKIDLVNDIPSINTFSQVETLEKLVNYRNRYLEILDNVEYILNNQDQFIDLNVIEINKIADLVKAWLLKVKKYYFNCYYNYLNCTIEDEFLFPKLDYPQRVSNLYYTKQFDFNNYESQNCTVEISSERLREKYFPENEWICLKFEFSGPVLCKNKKSNLWKMLCKKEN